MRDFARVGWLIALRPRRSAARARLKRSVTRSQASTDSPSRHSSTLTVAARALVIRGTTDVMSVDSAREWAAALPSARLTLRSGDIC